MICGTIPALRPLLVPARSRKSEEGGYYERYASSKNKLTPVGNNEIPLIPTIGAAGKHKQSNVERSASQERIVEMGRGGIRRTDEVEISNDAAGGEEGGRDRGSRRRDWDAV